MKKAIALFLALVSLVTISVPAHAAPADYEMNLDDLTTTSSPILFRRRKEKQSTNVSWRLIFDNLASICQSASLWEMARLSCL